MQYAPISLTPRLSAAADLVPHCDCFADIGTDHAHLPVFLCMNDKCRTAIASDIRKGPLSRAENTVSAYGMERRISLRLGAGLETLCENEADAVSIAGMGGLVIAKILKDGIDKLTSAKKIILQPMTSVSELRKFLWQNGWTIDEERLAVEDTKVYNIISVSIPSNNAQFEPTDIDIYIGKNLIENRPYGFEKYFNLRIQKLKKMINGLKLSKSADASAKIDSLTSLLERIEELK